VALLQAQVVMTDQLLKRLTNLHSSFLGFCFVLFKCRFFTSGAGFRRMHGLFFFFFSHLLCNVRKMFIARNQKDEGYGFNLVIPVGFPHFCFFSWVFFFFFLFIIQR